MTSKAQIELQKLIAINQEVLINHYANIMNTRFPKDSTLKVRYRMGYSNLIRIDIVTEQDENGLTMQGYEITDFFPSYPTLLSCFRAIIKAVKGATTIIK